MRTTLAVACLAVAATLSSGTAQADSIKGKFAGTGRLGFIVPAESDIGPDRAMLETDAGLVIGGGIMYGIDRNIAVELEMSHAGVDAATPSGSFSGDFDVLSVGLGVQYRFDVSQANLTPYAGGGVDIIMTDFSQSGFDVDTVPGVFVKGGADYFLNRQVALNVEGKFVLAPNADINGPMGGNFDPTGFTGSVGVRYFFN